MMKHPSSITRSGFLAGINSMQQLNVALGVQKAVFPLDRVADMSLARDAAKLAAR